MVTSCQVLTSLPHTSSSQQLNIPLSAPSSSNTKFHYTSHQSPFLPKLLIANSATVIIVGPSHSKTPAAHFPRHGLLFTLVYTVCNLSPTHLLSQANCFPFAFPSLPWSEQGLSSGMKATAEKLGQKNSGS